MRIWFCRSNDIGGWLIRLFTFSRWNHCAIEIDGVIYEAMTGVGVRKLNAYRYSARWAEATAVHVPLSDKQAALDFLNEQVGRPYDWKAILAFLFRGSWQDRTGWFCSELVYEALRVGGGLIPDRLPANRITPRDLWVALP